MLGSTVCSSCSTSVDGLLDLVEPGTSKLVGDVDYVTAYRSLLVYAYC